MKTIFRVFLNDIGSISKHFFVLVIVIGIVLLPALYAWANIYAVGDPYENTGNLPVAVASEDPGYYQTDGTYVNAAREIEDELKKKDNVDWKFTENAETAVEGVRSGKYYAAIVFEDNFTYNMYNLKEALVSEEEPITYYTNTKKNAVAAKITDTVANNLLGTINTKYLEAIFDQMFEDANSLSDSLDSHEAVDNALLQLSESRDAIHDFNASVQLLSATGDDISRSLKNAEKNLDSAREKSGSDLEKAEENIRQAKKTLKTLTGKLDKSSARLKSALSDLDKAIAALENAVSEEELQKAAQEVKAVAQNVLSILKEIRALLPASSQSSAVQILTDTVDLMILQTEEIIRIVEADPAGSAREAADAVRTLLHSYDDSLVPGIRRLATDMENAVKVAKPLLSAAGGMLGSIDPVLESADDTVSSLDVTLVRLRVVLTSLEDRLDDIISQVEAADEEDRVGLLTKLMGGDPKQYSRFFSTLVRTNDHEIYSVHSYGAAMCPFFSVLAIWVGGVMLAAVLRTGVNRRKFPGITETQAFFGRYLLFLLLGQLQAAIIVLGDIYLLHCSPVHPWLMWAAAAITSMVFITLIYALVLSFGNIGKAFVVVFMVLQIAGSSGSYPIEILPVIYAKIYKFFPFPYAINGMREAICGMYGYDFLIYFGQLMVFFAAGLVIGLLVRRPFIGVNSFITEKLEETEVL